MSVHTDLVQRVGGKIVRRPPPRKRPPNKSARLAVDLARNLLDQRGCELTTERKGKWHLLSQVFAESSRDLRHHLTASLRRKSEPLPPEPPTLQEVLAAVEMSRAENPKR
jgi:hypothetical protein